MTSLIRPLASLRNGLTSQIKSDLHTSACARQSFRKWYQNLWTPSRTLPPYEHITQVGDPVLRRKADDVPAEAVTSKEVKYLVGKMVRVLQKYKCVGLAAPQIGTPLNVLVMEFSQKALDGFSAEIVKAKRMEVLPLTVLINPKMTVTSHTKTSFVESCESVRGYSAEVPRFDAITIQGSDTDGKQQTLQLSGWNARIAQHEMDHLNGILYTDIMNQKSFSCTCWQAVNAREGRVYINFEPK